jgi:hypothetical protein
MTDDLRTRVAQAIRLSPAHERDTDKGRLILADVVIALVREADEKKAYDRHKAYVATAIHKLGEME